MNWWSLRAVGNLAVLKVSYVVLLVAPFLSQHADIIRLLGLPNWLVAALFLASLSLALANLIYDIWCPTIIKRFASPNDLYEKMLKIAKLSHRLYPSEFDASLEHCKTAYEVESESRFLVRWVATVLFFVSGVSFLVVLGYRAWVVFAAAFTSGQG